MVKLISLLFFVCLLPDVLILVKWRFSLHKITTLCLKKVPPLTCYNLYTHGSIATIFGTNVAKKVGYQNVLYFPPHLTSASILPLWFLSFFFLFSSLILNGWRLHVYHTSAHDVALVQLWNACLKCGACSVLFWANDHEPSLCWWHHPVGNFGGRTTGVSGSSRPS